MIDFVECPIIGQFGMGLVSKMLGLIWPAELIRPIRMPMKRYR